MPNDFAEARIDLKEREAGRLLPIMDIAHRPPPPTVTIQPTDATHYTVDPYGKVVDWLQAVSQPRARGEVGNYTTVVYKIVGQETSEC